MTHGGNPDAGELNVAAAAAFVNARTVTTRRTRRGTRR
jgi:hypothetical protein